MLTEVTWPNKGYFMSHTQNSVYFTFQQSGQCVKITAIDEQSHVEAVVIAPASLSQNDMKTLAYQKLKWILQKKP